MTASQFARSVREPMDHQPKAQRTRHAKPGRFDSAERRRFNLALVAARVNAAARVVTVAGLLAARGASADLVRTYASAVGRAAAKAYRTAIAAEPQRVGLAATAHRLVWGFGYSETDRALLDAVIDGYEVKSPKRARLTDLIGTS